MKIGHLRRRSNPELLGAFIFGAGGRKCFEILLWILYGGFGLTILWWKSVALVDCRGWWRFYLWRAVSVLSFFVIKKKNNLKLNNISTRIYSSERNNSKCPWIQCGSNDGRRNIELQLIAEMDHTNLWYIFACESQSFHNSQWRHEEAMISSPRVPISASNHCEIFYIST